MPSGVNTQNLFTNTQFQQFVEFAKTSKTGDIAKMSLRPGGKEHSITATTESFIGKLFRSDATKQANNYARTIFKESIAKMFGGEDHIPDSVKDAMKMNDFDKGRPLTARRILAVKTAIDQVADKMKTCVEETKADFDYNVDEREKCDAMIEKAFIACKGNTDTMDIVKTHAREIMVNNESSLRTEESMQKKVDGLLDNLSELKELSKKNPAIYTAGKQMLRETGTALPKGMITKMVQASNEASIKGLRKLTGSSSAVSIHDVTVQMYKSIKHAMSFSGADKMETPEKMAARDFIASTILSRCSKSALLNIRSALNTEDASCLNEYYSLTSAGRNDCADDKSRALQDAVKDVGTVGTNYLEILDINVNRNLDRLEPNVKHDSRIPIFHGEFDIDDAGGKAIVDRTIDMAKEINEELAQNFINDTVQGSGQGADAFKAVLKQKIGESNNPSADISKRLSANANAMMNWSFCAEMKKNGIGTQFQKDIDRGCNATLTDGKTTIKLTQNFETARNELAQFVTGDPKATYDTLKNDGDKAKVHMLMSLISQETEKAGEDGTKYAIEKRESDTGFNFGGFSKQDRMNGKGADAVRAYTIEKRADGGIDLHYTMDKPIKDIDDGTTGGDGYPVGEGSKFVCKMDYSLKGDEFNRLAKLDYGKFDDSEGYKIFNRKVDMPDGSRQFRENKLEKVVDSFAQEFKINATCEMDFTMTLNPTDEEMMAEQIKERR